jgi:ferritin
MNNKINKFLNEQVKMEFDASYIYLKLATMLESAGYSGASEFMYRQSEEERFHMMKLIRFIIERGGEYTVPNISVYESTEKYLRWEANEHLMSDVFKEALRMEQNVTQHINRAVGLCKEEKDYTTENFLQWFVTEQIEEESVFNTIVDKLKIIGGSGSGLYMLDTELSTLNLTQE